MSRTGLDHLCLAVAERADLNAWAAWLPRLKVRQSGEDKAIRGVHLAV